MRPPVLRLHAEELIVDSRHLMPEQQSFPGLAPEPLPPWTSRGLEPGSAMARRHAWAKIYCDLLRHPKIIGRPDSDVRLFVGLILHAKEYSPDDGLVQLSPTDMRNAFGIKASMKSVAEGLAYFVKEGVLLREGEQYRIRDFAARQSADSAAERMQRWRDGRVDNNVTKRNGNVTFTSPEVEVEKENVDSSKGGVRGGISTAPVSVDNSDLEGLNPSDKAEIQALLTAGAYSHASARLAELRKRGGA